MANSSRTPLLRQNLGDSSDDEESAGPSNSRVCCFDRVAALFKPRNIELASGPLLLLIVYCFSIYHHLGGDASSRTVGIMLGILAWMAVWWMLAPVPVAITSLLPLLLYPTLGIMSSQEVATTYFNDVIVLMIGTFIIALAISKYSLHKRMALKILLITGGQTMDPRLVLLGFLIGPAFVSLWMSNTSAATMMTPMAAGVLQNLSPDHHVTLERSKSMQREEEGRHGHDREDGQAAASGGVDEEALLAEATAAQHKFSQGVILAVTFGTAVGGMGTQIGCGPDLVLPGVYSERFPGAPQVTFLSWMVFAMPLVLLWLAPMWLYLCWSYSPFENIHMIQASLNRSTVEKTYEALGPMKFSEIFVFCEFFTIVTLWITRTFGQTPGWADLLHGYPGDGTVAILGAILLFVVPNIEEPGTMLMDWKTCKDIRWGVILLLGGGFALSNGIQTSGVASWIGSSLEAFHYVPYLLLAPIIATLLGIITEFSSNVANATLFLPIFAEVAVSINVHPLLLMIPVTLASSYAFILPSGTPPNAIALGSGYLTVPDMVKPGLVMHLIGTIVLTILIPTLGAWVFDLDQPASSLSWLD